jgi:Fis family transcriptional regulator
MLRDLEKLVAAMVSSGIRYPDAEREFERRFLEAALKASNGSIVRCAELTGLHRNTLARKIERHGLDGRPASRPARARRVAKR